MDFSLTVYQEFLDILNQQMQNCETFADYLKKYFYNSRKRIFLIRHDVDLLPQNSLTTAKLEKDLGIKGTYYFRIVPESYDLEVMEKIAEMGHEIGYHYEDVDLVLRNEKSKVVNENGGVIKDKLIEIAFEYFCNNLEFLRNNFDIQTICMHGSPKSKYDNKIIWDKYDYRKLGILGEPYFDIDWNEFAYFTDTGRRWNGNDVSIRDKVSRGKYENLGKQFKSTKQIIKNINKIPDKVMFTIHPQRWTNNPILWTRELIAQNLKNIIKKMILRKHENQKDQFHLEQG